MKFVFFLLFFGACAPVAVQLRFSNSAPTNAVVRIQAVDESGIPLYQTDVEVDGGTLAAPGQASLSETAPYNAKTIKVETQYFGSKLRQPEPDLVVPANKLAKNTFLLSGPPTSIDEASSISQLQSLSTIFGKNSPRSLVDVLRAFSKVVVINQANDTVIDEFAFNLPIRVEPRKPTENRIQSYVNKTIMQQATITVPVYGSIGAQVSNADIYRLSINVKHYPVENPFTLDQLIATGDPQILKRLRDVLAANPTSRVKIITSVHVVDTAVFALEKGQKSEMSASLAIASVVSTKGEYLFASETANFDSVSDAVVAVSDATHEAKAAAQAIDSRFSGTGVTKSQRTMTGKVESSSEQLIDIFVKQ